MYGRLSPTQIDVIKEVSTIGSANAATALSGLINQNIGITVPQVSLVPIENISKLLGGMENLYFVLDTELKGDISGRIFLLFSPEDARFLGSILLGCNKEDIDFNDDMFQSSLKESANILGGSYLTAMAEMTNLTILNSTPSFAMDMVGAILDFIFIQIAQYSEEVLFIKTELTVRDQNMGGLLFLFPSVESLRKIFEVLDIKE